MPRPQRELLQTRQTYAPKNARELEVLTWLARGKSNAEIGPILGISSGTVGKHLEHIYPKLGVENRTAAASFSPERDLGHRDRV